MSWFSGARNTGPMRRMTSEEAGRRGWSTGRGLMILLAATGCADSSSRSTATAATEPHTTSSASMTASATDSSDSTTASSASATDSNATTPTGGANSGSGAGTESATDSTTANPTTEGLESCPGVEPWPEGSAVCRTNDDCDRNFSCVLDGSVPDPGCGGCGDPCGGDSFPCQAPSFCVFKNDGCCGVCVSDCTVGAMCEPDWTCNPNKKPDDDGYCEAVRCDAGFVCPNTMVCHPKAPGGDAHGCVDPLCGDPGGTPCSPNASCSPEVGCLYDKMCEVDDDCACGTCVAHVCRDRPGLCVTLDLPP